MQMRKTGAQELVNFRGRQNRKNKLQKILGRNNSQHGTSKTQRVGFSNAAEKSIKICP